MEHLPIDSVIHGEAKQVLKNFPENSIDAVCIDPPAGISFMNRSFDSDRGGRDAWISWLAGVLLSVYRVMKPGAHAFVWALPRTSHWTGLALEYAGFEVRDCCYHLYAQDEQLRAFVESLTNAQQEAFWRLLYAQEDPYFLHLFGSGMPKSLNISKAIDKLSGAEREVVGRSTGPGVRSYQKLLKEHGARKYEKGYSEDLRDGKGYPITAPTTDEAIQYNGWGTGLKPSVETWWLVRKPISERNVAQNVLRWGTGGLNIDGCRIPTGDDLARMNKPGYNGTFNPQGGPNRATSDPVAASGRWPAHLFFSHSLWCTEEWCHESCPIKLLDQQSGARDSHGTVMKVTFKGIFGNGRPVTGPIREADTGTASRYFQRFNPFFLYTSKPSQKEKNLGCEAIVPRQGFDKNTSQKIAHINHETGQVTYSDYQPSVNQNSHPCVKSISLLRYLLKLITPPGGTVLDCFAGSGSTALAALEEGFHYVLVEEQDTKEEPYVSIARARIATWKAEREGK